ncbi:MAG: hypothetical protein ACOYNS_08015 [Bacteroidota bacterium]
MNKLAYSIIIILGMIHWSCESPLSEKPVVDPYTIQPIIKVIKEIDYKGTTYYRYRADIYDQYIRSVELQDGGIKVNNENLMVIKDALGTYYMVDDQRVKYKLNTKYLFTIIMSDQSTYKADITTHSTDLFEFNTPVEQDKTQDMNVSWKDTDTNSTMYLTVGLAYKTESSSGYSSHYVKIPNPRKGSFVLLSENLKSSEGTAYRIDLTLNSEVAGTIDSSFYLNRRAFSLQQISKSITLK